MRETTSRILIESFAVSQGRPFVQREWLQTNYPELLARPLDDVLSEKVLEDVVRAFKRKHVSDPDFASDFRFLIDFQDPYGSVRKELNDVWNQ